MGLFGFLKKKGETIRLPPEEPEFLKNVDLAGAAETAEGVKEQVEPELALWLSNGTAVTGLKELAAALKKMKAADYKEHVNPERNEIAEWVQEILNDGELARKLRQAKGKMLAAKAIEKEIKALKFARKASTRTKTSLKGKTAAEQLPQKKTGRTPKLELSDMPELGEELQNMKSPYDSFEEKLQTTGQKHGLFSRLFGKKPKEERKQLPESKDTIEPIDEDLETPIEMPRVEDFKQNELPAPSAEEFEPEPHHAKWEETSAPAEMHEGTIKDDNEELEQASLAATNRKLREFKVSRSKARLKTENYNDYEGPALIRQDEELERTEKELTRQEEELNSKRLELTRKRYELIKQKGELESKKFEEFIRKHKNRNEKEEALVREELYSQESTERMQIGGNEPQGRLAGMPDFRLAGAYGKERLEELLEEAKQHIRQNNMDEAQSALHEVQSVFDTVYMTNNEKKQIEYEILEVEADLKLASLK